MSIEKQVFGERPEPMDMDSPEPNATESISIGASSVSDFDGMSDTTATTPFSSYEASTGDGPPSVYNEIKVEIEDNDEGDEEVFGHPSSSFISSECFSVISFEPFNLQENFLWRGHSSGDNYLTNWSPSFSGIRRSG